MSCPLPKKSFFLSISLTSSPINREECLLSFHRYLFVSLLRPFSPSLSVSRPLLLSMYFLSLSLPLCWCCVMHISNQWEWERESAVGVWYTKLSVGCQGPCWVSVADHRPYILLSGCSRLLLMTIVHSELLAEKPVRGFVYLAKQICYLTHAISSFYFFFQ